MIFIHTRIIYLFLSLLLIFKDIFAYILFHNHDIKYRQPSTLIVKGQLIYCHCYEP